MFTNDQEALERLSRIEVQRWFRHLATLSAIERDECIAIYNAETDVNDKVEGAQEKLDALIKARAERIEYAKFEEAQKKADEAKAAELLQAEPEASADEAPAEELPASDIPDEPYHAGRHRRDEE